MRLGDLERRAQQLALEAHPHLEDVCLAFDGLVREAVGFAAAAWSTHDPATGLFTSCTVSGLPKDLEREATFFRFEFRDDEPATFTSMIANRRTVAVLSEETGGDLESAARYREFLSAYGCSDELRVVLWADDQPWGSAVLYRVEGTYGREEAKRVASVAPHVAQGMRLALLRAAASRPRAVTDPPGIVQVAIDGRVEPVTEPAERWLVLGGDALITAVNAVAAAVRGNRGWAGSTSRLTLADARMITLHAARTASDDDSVAVIIDAARPAQVAAMLIDAYGLTGRQRDVLGKLLLGGSMKQIARELGISEHTANDHRKAIYERVGVASRNQLAARLQAEHYDPLAHRGVTPSPYGGFLQA